MCVAFIQSQIPLLQVYGFLSPLLTKTHNRNHTHPRAYISIKLQQELDSVFILYRVKHSDIFCPIKKLIIIH